MKFKLLAVLLFLMPVISSCAPKEEVKPPEAAAVQPAAEKPAPAPEEAVETAKPAVEPQKPQEQYIMLNFDNADIETVISTIGEMLKINYIMAPGVTGKITIQSHNKVPLSELFSTFQTILEFNGFTAVKSGNYYLIVPIDNAKQQAMPVGKGKAPALPKDSGFITQQVPLMYVKASDVANIVRNLMPRGTDITVYDPANMLIITAQPAGLVKLLKLLEAIDIPPSEREAVRTFVYYVENGEAKKLVELLKNIYGKKKEGAAPVAKPVTTPAPPQTQQGIPLRRAVPQPTPAPAAGGVVLQGLAGEIEGEIVLEAYEDINAIIIKTTPMGYIALLDTIKKLDVQPKQVLIEVMIVEIKLDKTNQFGLEWLIKATANVFGDNIGLIGGFSTAANAGSLPQFDTTQNMFTLPVTGTSTTSDQTTGQTTTTTGGTILSHPSDLFATILDPTKFSALITAAATKGNAKVLASPNILGLDNKEAKIEIGQEVPVATSVTQPIAGAVTTGITTTSQVQFKQVGTLLTVTPHINEKKQVTLKISQEQSNVGSSVLIGGQAYTGFDTRKANTTAIVQDGHTLVLGGIIQEQDKQSREGIPFLSDIPLLGYLFGTTTDEIHRSELIIMVTPHVITNTEEADELTKEVKNRVKELKEKIEAREEKLRKSMEDLEGKPEKKTSESKAEEQAAPAPVGEQKAPSEKAVPEKGAAPQGAPAEQVAPAQPVPQGGASQGVAPEQGIPSQPVPQGAPAQVAPQPADVQPPQGASQQPFLRRRAPRPAPAPAPPPAAQPAPAPQPAPEMPAPQEPGTEEQP